MKIMRAPLIPTRVRLLAGGAALAALLLATTASAQVLSQTPYAPPPDPAMERLSQRIDAMEAEVRRVTNQNEQLTNQLNQARRSAEQANSGSDQLRRELESMTARVSQLEAIARGDTGAAAGVPTTAQEGVINLSASASTASGSTGGPIALADVPAGAPAAPATPAITLPADEAGHIKEARNLLLAGDYPSAQQAFSQFLTTYPKSPEADEAQYFLGESLLYQSNYSEAATAYGKLLADYGDSDRGPEALVKLARSMRLMDKKGEACKALGLMSTRFPKASNAAKTLASTERSRAGC